MRRIALVCLAALLLLAIWLWLMGGADQVSRWANAMQRDVQNAMASSLRALRTGQPGALVTLWGLCFGYGFVHAAGPGHGKLIIGGYGVGARVPARRLAGLAVISSLAQALTAVVVVYLALWIFGWGRAQLTGLADGIMAPLSYALIAGIGLWLMLRGLRRAWRMLDASRNAHEHKHHHEHQHDHDHVHDDNHGVCESCGHAHAPTLDQAAAIRSLRDALAVIGAIAIRPCTGAIFLLILTHALGLDWAGIAGAFIMGLGTASFTGVVALAAVGMRESALAQTASSVATARLIVGAEIAAGIVIAGLALQLLARSI